MLNFFSSLFGAVLMTLYYRKVIVFDESSKMPIFFKVYWIFTTLSVVTSTTITFVYWPFDYIGRDLGLNDFLTHTANSILMVVDVLINAHPPRFGHYIYPLSFGAFYSFIFSVPYTLLGGTDKELNNYIYSVVDWRNKTSSALIFVTCFIMFSSYIHFIITSIAWSRSYIFYRFIKSRKIQLSEAA